MVATLEEIKLYCRIDPERTVEDTLLTHLEEAARLHTENILQKPVESAGANVKQAVLFLISHWYRNREAVIIGTISSETPLAYDALLWPEKNFLTY